MRGVDGDSDSDRTEGSVCNGVVKATKRVKARERFLPALPGVLTHARGRGVSGNVAIPLLRTFARPPATVDAEECERRTCACAISDWLTVNNGAA